MFRSICLVVSLNKVDGCIGTGTDMLYCVSRENSEENCINEEKKLSCYVKMASSIKGGLHQMSRLSGSQ